MITSNRIVLFVNSIPEIFPGGCDCKYLGFLCFLFLTEFFPPIFDMENIFEEHKSNIFSIRKVMDKKIPFY
jgi:hypothetical protein